MNFFERQTQTRRLSRQLVVLFALAVVASSSPSIWCCSPFSHRCSRIGRAGPATRRVDECPSWRRVVTTLSVIGVIGLSSLYKTAMLSGGGGVVARSLGGVRVSADTTDPQQRRLLNVVEEMSIASGVPMPEVYLLEQEAGYQCLRGRAQSRQCSDRSHPRRADEAESRGAAGRHRARVQPHSQWRHAPQRAPDGTCCSACW